jgi:hypothetical protein
MPNTTLITIYLHVRLALLDMDDHLRSGRHARGERGQATTEYALILLAAALVGLMVVAWATAGGGAARISRLFNSVIDSVVDKV